MQIRPVVVLVIAASCILAGFAAGWFYRSHQRIPDAALEDYAISSILGDLAYAHFLASDDTKTARALIDTSLHANLNRVREHSGAITDPAFVEAKVRTLQAVALYWQANPPFTSPDYTPSESNAFWIDEWKRDQAQNARLLSWAQGECASHPEFKCKQR